MSGHALTTYFSNCPTHIDNVRTHSNTNTPNYINLKANIINNSNPVLSDHSILSCNYTSKDICIPQQFKIIRNNKLLTKEKLQYYFNNNIALNNIFSYTEPNIIANTIINELSNIIELISPSK